MQDKIGIHLRASGEGVSARSDTAAHTASRSSSNERDRDQLGMDNSMMILNNYYSLGAYF